jgi:hypothetical protein
VLLPLLLLLPLLMLLLMSPLLPLLLSCSCATSCYASASAAHNSFQYLPAGIQTSINQSTHQTDAMCTYRSACCGVACQTYSFIHSVTGVHHT